MLLTIFIAFFGLIGLMVLHEFGHFLLAKIFKVKVEEFGIGYPPRLIGKKFGETIYSINLLPFGAFVKMPGEIEKLEEKESFSSQPVSKRILIALGGVISFWLISAIIFGLVFNLGNPVAIGDEENHFLNSNVQIVQIAKNSPAEISGLKVGDIILKVRSSKFEIGKVNKVKEIQEFTNSHLGEEIILTIKRGKKVFDVSLIPRKSPPKGEGPIGVVLVRTKIEKYPFPLSLWQGILNTGKLTLAIIRGYFQAISNLFKGLPSGVEMRGPIGIFQILIQASETGLIYFLNFLALISIYLALFNILPIPATDGGKILFLTIEAIRKKPISQKTEQKITTICFSLLIFLAIFVTIKDILRLF